jgi:type VI secretion system secreted protein Hcp
MAIYMEVAGLTGDVTSEGHENWITVQSVQWGSSRGVSTSGEVSQRTKSAVQVREVSITKETDSASGKLVHEHWFGAPKLVKIDWTSTSAGGEVVFLQVELKNSLISSYSLAGHGSDRPMEQISFNFTEITWTFYTMDKTGTSASKPFTASYNLSTA